MDVVGGLVEVVFVVDLAHDLLEHILDGHQAGDAAVLIDDDGDVIAVGAELPEQVVETLGFRNEHRRPQDLADAQFLASVYPQEILGQEDAYDLVQIAIHHRKARMAALDDARQELLGRGRDVDDIHARARHHDVACRQLGGLQHALDHGKRLRVQQVALACGMQECDELLAVFGFAHQERREALEQAGSCLGGKFFHGNDDGGVAEGRRETRCLVSPYAA